MKKVVVISGANLYSGGTLSILQDCIKYLDSDLYSNFNIYVIVNNKDLFDNVKNINFIEIKKIRYSYLHRLYYEYFHYLKISKKIKPYFWLSLNDISPNIISERRAVYCHNPSPFRKISFKDLYYQKEVFFFSLFYKFLYRINIKKNNYVIVQQNWIRESFSKMFPLKKENIILFPPQVFISNKSNKVESINNIPIFIYPTLPRPFKNIELICEAAKILVSNGTTNFKIIITIDGSENTYSSNLVKKFKKFIQLDFIGFIKREEVFNYYSKSDCLIFPSTLETWGLPITEFKSFDKPILLADLEYAHETIGDYNKAVFFDAFKPEDLADKMLKYLNNDLKYDKNDMVAYNDPVIFNWDQFFKLVLK